MTAANNGGNGGKVSDLTAAKPFLSTVDLYRKALWLGTVPLPARDKFPPPTGFTGHRAPHPSPDKIKEWKSDPKHKRANIGIRLAGVTPEHEIIGIDVDHYISGKGAKAKDKRGGEQLARLESELGTLPATWISSARDDGISGIRYYRIPRGLAFKGQADKDIEVIYKGYRYGVVWPSIHPTGDQYWWYPPGEGDATVTLGDRDAWEAFNDKEIPNASKLPLLPEKWIDYLSAGGMRAEDNESIDMDISVNDLVQWADDTFNPGGEVLQIESDANAGSAKKNGGSIQDFEITGLCSRVAKSVIQQRKKISEDATSHDKLTEFHWHMYRLASEGHIGWKAAITHLEQVWIEDVMNRDKRTRAELRGEIFRSSINALRKIKAQVDQRISLGGIAVDRSCGCRGSLHAVGVDDDGDAVVSASGGSVVSVVASGGVGTDGSGDGDGDDDDNVVFDFDNFKFQYAVTDDDGNIVDIKDESEHDADNLDPILRYVLNGAAKPPNEYEMNDDGNAQHFLDLFSPVGNGSGGGIGGRSGGKGTSVLRWVEGVGWLIWCNGGHNKFTNEIVQPQWIIDTDGLIRRAWWMVKKRQQDYAYMLASDYQLALTTAQTTGIGMNQAGTGPAVGSQLMAQKKEAEGWREFARKSGNNNTANAAIEALKQKSGITMDINAFDADPMLLGVSNGVIDLSEWNEEEDEKGNVIGYTPKFREAHPEDLILLNTNVDYKRYDKCGITARNMWEKYLNTFINVGDGGEDYLRAVQMFLGYGIIGSNPERIFLMIKGPSSTGKSTMLNAIGAALGDYAMTANMSIYQSHKLNPMLARAIPKRIVMTSELSSDTSFSVEVLKNITGNEIVSAELKGSNAIVERRPAFMPIIATNSAPEIKGADEALQRRLIVLPFNNAVDPMKIDASITSKIESECGEAILSWLVEGYLMYRQEKGLPRFDSVIMHAVAETMSELDHVLTFLAETTAKHPQIFGAIDTEMTPEIRKNWTIKVSVLFNNYENWCNKYKIHHNDRVDSRALTNRLKSMGFVQKNVREGGAVHKTWIGVKSTLRSIISSNSSEGTDLLSPENSLKKDK